MSVLKIHRKLSSHFNNALRLNRSQRLIHSSLKCLESNASTNSLKGGLSSQETSVLYRRVLRGISVVRARGHYAATLDPLAVHEEEYRFAKNLKESKHGAHYNEEHKPDVVRFFNPQKGTNAHEKNLSVDFDVIPIMGQSIDPLPYFDDEILNLSSDLFTNSNQLWSVNKLVKALKLTYAGPVGVEIGHVEIEGQKHWLLSKVEKNMSAIDSTSTWNKSSDKQRIRNIERLLRTEQACKVLNKKFPSSKVFGIEGCEALIPGLISMIGRGAHKWGMEGVEMGMAHRGRMNVLHDVLNKSFSSICKYILQRSAVQCSAVYCSVV